MPSNSITLINKLT